MFLEIEKGMEVIFNEKRICDWKLCVYYLTDKIAVYFKRKTMEIKKGENLWVESVLLK